MKHAMLVFLTAIPLPLQALLIGAAYGAIVRWRFSWPMLLDALLIGVLLMRPSIGLLAWVGMLIAVRHIPTLAADVVVLLRCHEFDGWTTHVLLFTLPALRAYTSRGQETGRRGDRETTALPPPIAHAPALPTVPLAPLHPTAWLGAINDDQTAPHLGVVGPTRLGKTTFVLAALGRRAGLLVITTPKAADEDPWGGADVVRLLVNLETRAFDWTPIERAIDSVHFEMLRRNATNTVKDAPRLNLIVDELSTTLANCARKTKSQILELWNMGAGAHINVIVCDPEVNATAWGIQGRRDILGNLVFAQVAPGRRWALGRIDPNGRLVDPQPLDTSTLRSLAGEAQLAGRAWAALPVPGRVPDLPPPPATVPAAVGSPGTGNGTERGTPIAVLRALRSSGITRDRAHELGCVFRDSDWTEAGKAAETKGALG